jgi:hypothetical protein
VAAADLAGSGIGGCDSGGHLGVMHGHHIRFLVLPLLLGACPMMDDDDDGGDEGSTPPSMIAGTVARTAAIAAGRDGIGTVYIGAFAECSFASPPLGLAVIPDADLSDTASTVDFAMEDLPEGAVHLALFLDDDGDADPMNPLPDPGDPVYSDEGGDGVLNCVEVEVGDEDIALQLTVTEPLLGVSGTVRRDENVAVPGGNDGVGTLFIGAFAECAHDGQVVGFAAIPDADVSDPDARVDFEIPSLPIDVVHLAFFLDDNGDVDPAMPLPGDGDLVFADDVEDGLLSCVTVDAGTEEIDLALNNVEAD